MIRPTSVRGGAAWPAVLFAALLYAFASAPLFGQAQTQTPPSAPDIPAKFTAPKLARDYEKREVMIPMRDGVKLYTVIVVW